MLLRGSIGASSRVNGVQYFQVVGGRVLAAAPAPGRDVIDVERESAIEVYVVVADTVFRRTHTNLLGSWLGDRAIVGEGAPQNLLSQFTLDGVLP